MKLKAIAQITYLVPLSALTREELEHFATCLEGYASDIRKGGVIGGHYVQFEIIDDGEPRTA